MNRLSLMLLAYALGRWVTRRRVRVVKVKVRAGTRRPDAGTDENVIAWVSFRQTDGKGSPWHVIRAAWPEDRPPLRVPTTTPVDHVTTTPHFCEYADPVLGRCDTITPTRFCEDHHKLQRRSL